MEYLLVGIIIALLWPPFWFAVAAYIALALYGHNTGKMR